MYILFYRRLVVHITSTIELYCTRVQKRVAIADSTLQNMC